jgi:CDP-glycerol glycerophosphotransferase
LHRRQQLELVLRRIGKAAPRGVRGPLGRASRRFRSWPGPLVTVVLAVSDEETTRIGPALESLRAQTHRSLDILVVPYGESMGVRAVAAEHADQDWRVRVLGRISANRAEARNAGAAAATGSYLLFAAGGDDVPARGIQRLVTSLEQSGSSLAVGRIQPPRTVLPSTEAPYLAAHQHDVSGTTLAASPWAVTDLAVGNRMFRRTFWREAGLRFTPELPNGSDVAVASLARATSFDLLRSPTYIPTNRVDGVSVGAVRDVLARLEPWLEEQQRIWRAVEALELPEVMNWLLWGVLDTAIQPFVEDVERATEHQWKTLRGHVELLLDSTAEHAWTTLRAESRVKLWLLLNDRRDALEEYIAARLFEGSSRPTEIVDGKVIAHLPFLGDAEVGVPAECYEMDETETPLRVVLRGVRWSGPETLELDVHARIEHVGFTDEPHVDAALVRSGTGERIELPLRQYVDPQANQTGGRRYQDYSRGALTLVVDARDLAGRAATVAEEGGDPASWSVELRVTTGGITRSGPVSSIDDRGSAGMIDTGHLAPWLVDGVRVGVTGRDVATFRLTARRQVGARLEDVQVSGRRVTGTIHPGNARPASVRVSMAGSQAASAPLTRSGDLLRFSLEVPRPWAGSETSTWRFGAVTADGTDVPVAWPDQAEQWLAVGAGELVVSRSASGGTDLVEAKDTLVLEDVELRDGLVRVTGRWLGVAPKKFTLRLNGRRASPVGIVEPGANGGGIRAQFATTWDEWGLGETAIPLGRYWFGVSCGPEEKPRTGRVLLGADLLDRLLDFTVTHEYRFRPIRSGREAGVFLMPPLTDDEKGPFAQHRLQEWYRSGEIPIDPDAVYLQSYAGATATDSQLAIHHELRRRRPELTLYWGVADRSSGVPEGAVPVLMYSREWYRVMASARYLCLNIDFDRWFAARPEQKVLQTFHGYPAKSMGIRMWEAKLYTPRRIALELARTSGDWDLILTPAPEMDVYYRTEYRYSGRIHSAGYPRDDVLVSPDAERVRTDVRARLGIAPEQKVVLYAPTWRDDMATDWRSAELVRHLDLESATHELGPDYVFLMRGHRFHARGSDRSERTARLLDVTDYPEINDLILASDAAVLDYSSLRFDFALTGRPMIFLVPDLATYTGGVRGFLYDFRDTAPGPLADTADEVVARLRDLPGLRRDYAAEQARFHAKYNYLQDGRAAERVVAAFFGASGESNPSGAP